LADEAAAAHADLMAVLVDAVEARDGELAARVASSLAMYWLWRGRWREGRTWIDRVRGLGLPKDSPHEVEMVRLSALLGSAEGDDARTRRLAGEAPRGARAIGDVSLEVRCLNELGCAEGNLGDVEAASDPLEQGLALATEEEHPTTRMVLLANAGAFAVRAGDPDRARGLLGRCLALAERHDNVKVMGLAQLNRGRLERHLGETRAAGSKLEHARALLEASGHIDLSARVRVHLARSFMAEGDLEAAASRLDDALAPWWEAGLIDRLPDAVRAVAALAARRGRQGRAVGLWRAADEIVPDLVTRLFPSELAVLEAAIGGALEEVGEARAAPSPTLAETVALAREAHAGRRRHVLRVRDTSAA
jgi:tetratricopeptide (TPR) repeat protein